MPSLLTRLCCDVYSAFREKPASDVKDFFPEILYALYIGDNTCGHPGFVHGGLIATLLDETSGVVSNITAGPGQFTANLNLDYVRPLPNNSWVLVRGKATKIEGRKLFIGCQVEINGTVHAKSTALFIKPREAPGGKTHAPVAAPAGAAAVAASTPAPVVAPLKPATATELTAVSEATVSKKKGISPTVYIVAGLTLVVSTLSFINHFTAVTA